MSRDRRRGPSGQTKEGRGAGAIRGATLWPARLAVVAAVGLFRVLPSA